MAFKPKQQEALAIAEQRSADEIRYAAERAANSPKWRRVERELCDLCDKLVVFVHPLGGKRCGKCPRPEI